MEKVIGILAGSLRKESFSKKIAQAIVPLAPEGYRFEIISLDGLEVYNQDFDDHDQVPESYKAFRETMHQVDGVMFITPEYNRSVPGVLKNALDIGSRPAGKSVWYQKPAAVFSNSPGNIAAFGANHHLRQSLVFLNMPVMQQPEVYLAKANELFNDSGALKEGETKKFIEEAVEVYVKWFERNAASK